MAKQDSSSDLFYHLLHCGWVDKVSGCAMEDPPSSFLNMLFSLNVFEGVHMLCYMYNVLPLDRKNVGLQSSFVVEVIYSGQIISSKIELTTKLNTASTFHMNGIHVQSKGSLKVNQNSQLLSLW